MIASVKELRDRGGGRRKGGFTLVEILIGTILSATLMLGVWSMFSTYINLFETGQAKAEQAQLIRVLMRQLSDDLHSAIQDPIAGRPAKSAGGSAAVRRFGLFGSQSELRLDVMQLTPFTGSLTPADSTQDASSRQPLRAPELRTVYYRFVPSGPSARADTSGQPGLSRRELDFETPYSGDDAGGPGGRDLLKSNQPDVANPALDGSPGELLVVDPADDSVMLVPEVTLLQFRYFDGRGWSSQWDSLQRKSLPVAIEVTMRVCSLEARQELYRIENESTLSAPEGELTSDPAAAARNRSAISAAAGTTHRVVIDLPGAPMHGAPQKARRTAVSLAAPRIPRRVRAPRPASRSSRQASPSDQWMRNEP